ncbi:diaminohydroxyphosphoribosylaminopyrimidine deaminase [Arcicella aurantiaca]|uniref:Riboflavin biosynthesis protein RibD n=1 Tax=Arcicella aurantiaca TaxID=591202 RepID=A0A316DXD5_9BACT|nr:bifunctional diaminohydroxyphosphoribosylaminopyrimidine deaminase/5-amino-6-(5-phosphoribosylamino)uracil reductase RibD [Arcicella aurantiaca]PWK21859.1 diaminohydroxyphosphoribosylaminopyrimidine deaminase [Arcicella aurantiaca]
MPNSPLTIHHSQLYMKRALQMARLGAGYVSPNPMVGCVIVHNGKIIGEGWHKKYGEGHAEVNAVNSVEDKSLLSESEVYVTLEPCSHYGKTPPCADLLIKHHVKKVIICNLDPNPLVAGKGIEKLRQAGIEVETGVLEAEGREVNKRFFTFIEKQRPYIILKWAESADGFIAKPNYQAVQISNNLSRRFVHKMRAEEDAIMVGTNTARYDNPKLDTRFWTGKNAIRVVIDKDLSLSKDLNIFDDSQVTICYNLLENKILNNNIWVKIEESHSFEKFIIQDLYQRKVQSVIIEGGTVLLQSFIDLGLWDEAIILKSKKILGEGINAPKLNKPEHSREYLSGDSVVYYKF